MIPAPAFRQDMSESAVLENVKSPGQSGPKLVARRGCLSQGRQSACKLEPGRFGISTRVVRFHSG